MKKVLTEKQKQRKIREKQLSSFRRYLSFQGHGDAVHEFLDMNVWELREYIEKQWLEGMTWENYRKVWCVDHIVALKYFDVFNYQDMKLCWHFSNLKPSFMDHNHAKGYCIEVTVRILQGLPQTIMVKRLQEKIAENVDMFHPYYNLKSA